MLGATLKRWLPLLLWMMVIFCISSSSDPYRQLAVWLGININPPEGQAFRLIPILSNDALGNMAHFGVFLILGVLVNHAMQPTTARQKMVGWLVCVLYALFDETHQMFVPNRTFQLLDLGLDCVASLVGLLVSARIFRKSLK